MIIICNNILLPTTGQVNVMELQPEADRHPPARLEMLSETEQMVLRSLRRWVAGFSDSNPDHWRIVWTEFAGRMGPRHGREALGGLEALVRVIWSHARQAVRCHRPCCSLIEADEHRILAFLAACQFGAWPMARLLADSLVSADGVGNLLQAGSRLGKALLQAGRRLPRRHREDVEAETALAIARPASALIH